MFCEKLIRLRQKLHFFYHSREKDWHRKAIGGYWEVAGKSQLDFFIKEGLRPEHYFLDIGCGSLRGGIHFIEFLEPGHYYGIEKEPYLIKTGSKIEIEWHNLSEKNPTLLLVDNFDLSAINKIKFDFMFAQSVFTHVPPEKIELCLKNIMPRLKQEGVFYATFNESEDGEIHIGCHHSWRRNEFDDVQYPVSFFQEVAKRNNVLIDYLGDWNSFKVHKMLAFKNADR